MMLAAEDILPGTIVKSPYYYRLHVSLAIDIVIATIHPDEPFMVVGNLPGVDANNTSKTVLCLHILTVGRKSVTSGWLAIDPDEVKLSNWELVT